MFLKREIKQIKKKLLSKILVFVTFEVRIFV